MRMNRWFRQFDVWIANAFRVDPVDLAVFRILYAAYVIVAVLPAASWLHAEVSVFFCPPLSLAACATDLPTAVTVAWWNVALAVAVSLLLVGWQTPASSWATGLLLLLLNSWNYSLGKINHEILLVAVPLTLAGSSWGKRLSLDSLGTAIARRGEGPIRSRSLTILAFILGVSMFTAGLAKAGTGWLAWGSQATLGHLVNNVIGAQRPSWVAEAFLRIQSPLFWKMADWSALLMELAFGVAFIRGSWMRTVIAAACVFHLGVWLLFGIVFAPNVVAYGAFVSYRAVGQSLLARWRSGRRLADNVAPLMTNRLARCGPLALALAIAGFSIVQGQAFYQSIGAPIPQLVVIVGALVGGCYLTSMASLVLRQLAWGLVSPRPIDEARRAVLREPLLPEI